MHLWALYCLTAITNPSQPHPWPVKPSSFSTNTPGPASLNWPIRHHILARGSPSHVLLTHRNLISIIFMAALEKTLLYFRSPHLITHLFKIIFLLWLSLPFLATRYEIQLGMFEQTAVNWVFDAACSGPLSKITSHRRVVAAQTRMRAGL